MPSAEVGGEVRKNRLGFSEGTANGGWITVTF
jgi:hypothetical protein